MTAATRISTPKNAETQATPPPIVVRAKLWMLASANISPTRTPTVMTEAESNCRITSETTIQAMLAMS